MPEAAALVNWFAPIFTTNKLMVSPRALSMVISPLTIQFCCMALVRNAVGVPGLEKTRLWKVYVPPSEPFKVWLTSAPAKRNVPPLVDVIEPSAVVLFTIVLPLNVWSKFNRAKVAAGETVFEKVMLPFITNEPSTVFMFCCRIRLPYVIPPLIV